MRACEERGSSVESETSSQNEVVAGLSLRGQITLVEVVGCIERSCVCVCACAEGIAHVSM